MGEMEGVAKCFILAGFLAHVASTPSPFTSSFVLFCLWTACFMLPLLFCSLMSSGLNCFKAHISVKHSQTWELKL